MQNVLSQQINPTTGTTASAGDNSSSNATTAYADRAAGGPAYVRLKDDFIGSGSASVTTATSIVFETGWGTAQITAGTAVVASFTGSTAHPGICRLASGGAATNGAAIYKGGGTNLSAPLGILGAATGWVNEWYFRTGSTITGYCIRLGMVASNTQVSDPPNNGFWLEYDTANTGNSNTNFVLRTVNSSTSTYTSLGVAPAASTWYRLRLSSTTAGTILAQLGVAGGALSAPVAVSTNVNNTLELFPVAQSVARAAAAAVVDLDYFEYSAPTARG